jgi:hypothetical protein
MAGVIGEALVNDVAVEYEGMASAGTSRATEAGRSSAKKHFNAFCNKKLIGKFELLSEKQLCDEKLFREFATYLAENAVKSNGELLMSGTAVQYLSAIKEMAVKKFAENVLWQERRLEKWYPSLRVALEKRVNRRQIYNGLPVSEKSRALGRELLKILSGALMKEGKIEAMKRRLAIIMTFLAVGRAGEAACSTWTSGVWDHEHGNFLMDWSELKTGSYCSMVIINLF